jgi:hypothetical protein
LPNQRHGARIPSGAAHADRSAHHCWGVESSFRIEPRAGSQIRGRTHRLRELGCVASYWDLEAYDDEVFMCLSLRQLGVLANALHVSARGLVSDGPTLPGPAKLTPTEIVAALRERLAASGGDFEALAEHLGWDVQDALAEPAIIWEKWCVVELRDVCEGLGLDWLGLLRHVEAPG